MEFFTLRLLRTKLYWSFKGYIDHQIFRISRAGYYLKLWRSRTHVTFSLIAQLVFLGGRGLVTAAFAIVFFETIEWLYSRYLAASWFELPNLAASSGDYVQLISQITATLLAIYFATFGIIISSGYSKLRQDVISLLLSEKVNSFYSRWLVNITVFCLLSSWLSQVRYETGFLVFVAATFGGIISLLCLFTMGNRLFKFFETSPLVEQSLVPEVIQAIRRSSSGAENSIHLQAHQQHIAETNIDTMNYLASLAGAEKFTSKEGLKSITSQYVGLLAFYGQRKMHIAPDSHWFKKKRTHENWFAVSDIVTSMALDTGRQIDPKNQPDYSWFETMVRDGLLSAFDICLEQGDFQTAHFIAFKMYQAAEALSKSMLLDDALALVLEFEKSLDASIAKANQRESANQNIELLLEQMAIYDVLQSAFQSTSIEYLRNIHLSSKKLDENIQAANWRQTSSWKFPNFLHQRAQQVLNWIEFEVATEGRMVSTNSYILQFLSQGFVSHVQESIEKISVTFRRTLVEKVKFLLSNDQPMAACQVLFGGFASLNQVMHFIDMVSLEITEIRKNEVYTDLPIPKPEFKEFSNEIENVRDELLMLISDKRIQAYLFKNIKHNETLPDYFGQSYFLLAGECYDALIKNNVELFEKYFPPFFSLACFAYSKKFFDEKENYSDEYLFALIGTVIEDMLSLSGYAIIYSELFENSKFKEIVENIWKNFGSMSEDNQQFLKYFVIITNFNVSSITARPRSLIRTNWKMQFDHKMRENGYGDSLEHWRDKEHPNPLVAAFYQEVSDCSDNLFIAEFILPKLSEDIELNHRTQSIIQSLERARSVGGGEK